MKLQDPFLSPPIERLNILVLALGEVCQCIQWDGLDEKEILGVGENFRKST